MVCPADHERSRMMTALPGHDDAEVTTCAADTSGSEIDMVRKAAGSP
jgi:hypothetical protein